MVLLNTACATAAPEDHSSASTQPERTTAPARIPDAHPLVAVSLTSLAPRRRCRRSPRRSPPFSR
ncbi:hypothetical protein C2S51_009118 [Perilla frutescens var. frutescens]|nr:hypothetical protein C2S51_009118 [Perilla frutescens var. frutescens]